MAITKTIEIDVDEIKAVGGLQNLDKAINETDKQTASLKTQLREATQELIRAQEEFGDYSKAALDAAKKVAGLKDQVQEAKETSALFDPGARFQAATGAIAAGANAVQGYQAALGLLGVEGEAAQQTLLKVQSAMALSQSLSGIADSAKDFQRLGAVAKQALAGIRTGIAATGIGVLVVALGAIVAYWDDIKEAVNGVSSEQEELNEKSKANLDSEQKKLDAISEQENTLKAQGLTEKDILNLKIKQTDQVIKKAEIDLQNAIDTKNSQIAAAKRNQDILAGTLKFLSLPLTMILKTVDAVGKALGKDFGLEDKVFKGLSSFVFDPVEVGNEADKAIEAQKKGLTKLKNDQDGFRNQVKAIDQKAKDEAKAKQDALDAKAKEKREKELEDLKKQKEDLKAIEESTLKEIEDLKAKTEVDKVALQKQRDLAELDSIKLSTEEKIKARLAIEEKYKILESEAKLKDAETKKEEEEAKKEKERIANEERLQKQKEFNDQLIAAEENLQNAKRQALSSGLDVLQQFAGKNKAIAMTILAIQKGLAIADVVVGATKAIGLAKASMAPTPLNPPFLGPGIPNPSFLANFKIGAASILATKIGATASIASILATGLGQAKAIAGEGGSAPSGGGGGASGGGAPNTQTTAPTFNVVGNSGVNQIQQTLGAQQPIQAYVVANNVTTAQSLDRNIIQNASLG